MIQLLLAALLCVEPTSVPNTGVVYEGSTSVFEMDRLSVTFFTPDDDILRVVEAHCISEVGCPNWIPRELLTTREPLRGDFAGVPTRQLDIVWCVEAEPRYTWAWFSCYDSEGREVFRSTRSKQDGSFWIPSLRSDGWIPIGGGP